MNKYEGALHRVCWSCDEYSMGACEREHCAVYVSIKELIDKQAKYNWHDLTKDSNDLPKENGYVMAMFKGETKPYVIYCLNGEFGEHVDFVHFELEGNPVETYFEFYDPDVDEVLAWKYIEEFEDDVIGKYFSN